MRRQDTGSYQPYHAIPGPHLVELRHQAQRQSPFDQGANLPRSEKLAQLPGARVPGEERGIAYEESTRQSKRARQGHSDGVLIGFQVLLDMRYLTPSGGRKMGRERGTTDGGGANARNRISAQTRRQGARIPPVWMRTLGSIQNQIKLHGKKTLEVVAMGRRGLPCTRCLMLPHKGRCGGALAPIPARVCPAASTRHAEFGLHAAPLGHGALEIAFVCCSLV